MKPIGNCVDCKHWHIRYHSTEDYNGCQFYSNLKLYGDRADPVNRCDKCGNVSDVPTKRGWLDVLGRSGFIGEVFDGWASNGRMLTNDFVLTKFDQGCNNFRLVSEHERNLFLELKSKRDKK